MLKSMVVKLCVTLAAETVLVARSAPELLFWYSFREMVSLVLLPRLIVNLPPPKENDDPLLTMMYQLDLCFTSICVCAPD